MVQNGESFKLYLYCFRAVDITLTEIILRGETLLLVYLVSWGSRTLIFVRSASEEHFID